MEAMPSIVSIAPRPWTVVHPRRHGCRGTPTAGDTAEAANASLPCLISPQAAVEISPLARPRATSGERVTSSTAAPRRQLVTEVARVCRTDR